MHEELEKKIENKARNRKKLKRKAVIATASRELKRQELALKRKKTKIKVRIII